MKGCYLSIVMLWLSAVDAWVVMPSSPPPAASSSLQTLVQRLQPIPTTLSFFTSVPSTRNKGVAASAVKKPLTRDFCNPRLLMSCHPNDVNQESNDTIDMDHAASNYRRQLLRDSSISAMTMGVFLSFTTPGWSSAALAAATSSSTSLGSSPDHPIVVLGAGGKVGRLCCEILSNQGKYVTAVTRSGKSILPESQYISYAAADVTKMDTLNNVMANSDGVIFAASASGPKKGGDPAHVDYFGVANTARACLLSHVPKLVVISAATVTRPNSAGFKATNYFVNFIYGERIMDNKIAGECVVRDLYSQQTQSPLSSYCIIRPGGLKDGPPLGATKLHVSQGDVYSAEICRADVAQVAVAALFSPDTDNTTLELNNIEGLIKDESSLPDLPSTLVHVGAVDSTYSSLFTGLLSDVAIKKQYPDIVNDYRGEGILPLDSFQS
jgi:uncharacterized protein YbjT (DUF2867 family)